MIKYLAYEPEGIVGCIFTMCEKTEGESGSFFLQKRCFRDILI